MHVSWNLCIILTLSTLTHQQGNVADTVWKIPGPAATNQDYSGDLVALLGGNFQLEWYTDLTSYSVYLWQQTLDGDGGISIANPIFTKASNVAEPGGYTWQVELETLDLDTSNVFFLALGTGSDLSQTQTCHYFNITTNTADVPPSQSSAAAATSATATSSSTTSATSTTATSSTIVTSSPQSSSTTLAAASPTAPAATNNTSSQGTTIGLGVGLGVGIPIIILLAAMLFLKVRKDRRRAPAFPGADVKHDTAPPEYLRNMAQPAAYGSQYNVAPQFPGESYQRHELPSTPAAPYPR